MRGNDGLCCGMLVHVWCLKSKIQKSLKRGVEGVLVRRAQGSVLPVGSGRQSSLCPQELLLAW